ncbi:MAG: hypothetical protein KDB14_17035 [Planctomycetales bacterium]|nr:hypothetical protein [Planctomycetales bacterium]
MVWPLLTAGPQGLTRVAGDGGPTGHPEDLNEAMVELTAPYPAIRVSDRMAVDGRPTEPLGWDVQAAHAIALARAGLMEEALQENAALGKKIAVNVEKGRLPDLQSEFLGKLRSQRSLLKQVQLQKSLILAIAGKTAESVESAAAAGQIEVAKATEDDQVAIQELLLAFAKVKPAGTPERVIIQQPFEIHIHKDTKKPDKSKDAAAEQGTSQTHNISGRNR